MSATSRPTSYIPSPPTDARSQSIGGVPLIESPLAVEHDDAPPAWPSSRELPEEVCLQTLGAAA